MVYLLTYELKSADKDYSALFNYLEHGLGTERIHVLRDCWWFASENELNIKETCNHIHNLLGDKDRFFFTQLEDDYTNGWLPSSYWSFYRENR